jgi:hypothetical protein
MGTSWRRRSGISDPLWRSRMKLRYVSLTLFWIASSSAAPLQVAPASFQVMDSANRVIGPAYDVGAGIATVVLSINGRPASVYVTATSIGPTAIADNRLYFQTADCTGDAWVNWNFPPITPGVVPYVNWDDAPYSPMSPPIVIAFDMTVWASDTTSPAGDNWVLHSYKNVSGCTVHSGSQSSTFVPVVQIGTLAGQFTPPYRIVQMPAAPSPVTTACVGPDGQMRWVNAASACRHSERVITW